MRRRTAGLGAVLTAAAMTAGFLSLTASTAGAAVSLHDPAGALDHAVLSKSTLTFGGWAADRDLPGLVRVYILIDGTTVRSVLANGLRADMAKKYPLIGKYRGFSGTIGIPTGRHSVCFKAANLGVGANRQLGCTVVRVSGEGTAVANVRSRAPFGRLDALSYAHGALALRGWSIDPDSKGSTLVDVSVNGRPIGSLTANTSRPDVAKAYVGYGATHGYSGGIPIWLASGNYSICAAGVNTGAGLNASLGCRIFTVLPVGSPAVLNTATANAAAAAMQARAIATHAAPASAFPSSATAAARIAIASRAFLQQATGRRAAPPAQAKLPRFSVASATRAPDVEAVMGAKPYLGRYPQVKKAGRTGVMHALEPYRNDPRPASPYGGDGVIGAAAILPANGRTVHPALPGYPAGYTRLRAEVAIDAALAHLGDPYVWAASGASTFDCSGLTQWAYAKAGVSLTHYTGNQAVQGVRVQANQLLPGDLVLFGGDLHHVGMYLGAGYMLDAPYTGAYVRIDQVSSFGDYSLAVRP
jgi:cell wall-associated NlpC family hydrolase